MKLISQKSHLRRRQECCDQLQDIGIALVRIVEAGRINKEHALPVKGELIGELNRSSTRSQIRSNTKPGTATRIDEL